jgi:cobyrinic acid a,c-diamide synthase
MQYLRAQGRSIAPFKAGPDFLDPMWHTVACDQTSYNLDTHMIEEDACRKLFTEKAADADVCVIEGVMGLFDGAKGVGGIGSSAHLAQTLDESVLLVISAKGMSGSIVPLVEGFTARSKAMGVRITGIIANHVGSENHARIIRELLLEFDLPPLAAWMQKGAPTLPERHLGLIMPDENMLPDFSDCFHVEDAFSAGYLGVPSLAQAQFTLARRAQSYVEKNKKTALHFCGKKIAVAKDAALCFVYPSNIEWLQDEGAEVLFFSPLTGEPVPQNADALWLPGGYPELHAEALSTSASLPSVVEFIESGKPALAECGGMLLLGESLCDQSAQQWPMASLLPCSFIMQNKLAGLGYRQAKGGVSGHEFHHSKRQAEIDFPPAFPVNRGDKGIRYKNLRASYIHWYFPSQPKIVAAWFGAAAGVANGH